MAASIPNSKVDFYFNKGSWQEETEQLRSIALDCGLAEELKWGVPCYTLPASDGKRKSNIVLIHVFKEYCAFLFFKGALMKDREDILIQQTENVQAARQIRFTNAHEIVKKKNILKAYIHEAIAVEKQGLKVPPKRSKDYDVPEEFQEQLDENPELKTAFYALTPGRQNAYLLYFVAAKQSKTRKSRVEKSKQNILKGKGLLD